MARLDPDQLKKRSDKAWGVKSQWRALRQDAYEMALPMRNPYRGAGSDGRNRGRVGQDNMDKLFDGTLMRSTIRFANRLQTDLTPAFQQWAELVPGPFIPDEKKQEITRVLQQFKKVMFAAIQVSNFDTSVNEFYLDLSIGTAVMCVREGDDEMPVRFDCVPQAECAFDEGPFGGVAGLFRKRTMVARNVSQEWKGFDLNLSDEFNKLVKDTPEKEIDLTEATYYDAEDDVWYYDVVWERNAGGGQKASRDRLVEAEYDESPWIVTRWIKLPGEIEGRGPVLQALPDAKTLNKLKQLVLMNASIAVSGVWTGVDDGVLNPQTVRIVPGAVIPVARNGGTLGASLQALQTGAKFDVAQLVASDLTMAIKETMMDYSLPPDEGPVRSATEIVARLKQLQQDIGSPFGRLMTEFIRPLIQKTLNILGRKGVIDLQGKKIKVNGGTVDVRVTSPLAQVQNLSEIDNVVKWMQIVGTVAGQEALMLGIKIEDVPAWLGEKMGVDAKLMRTPDERGTLQGMAGQLLSMRASQGGPLPAANGNEGPQPMLRAA